jgi:hypothetical protein
VYVQYKLKNIRRILNEKRFLGETLYEDLSNPEDWLHSLHQYDWIHNTHIHIYLGVSYICTYSNEVTDREAERRWFVYRCRREVYKVQTGHGTHQMSLLHVSDPLSCE